MYEKKLNLTHKIKHFTTSIGFKRQTKTSKKLHDSFIKYVEYIWLECILIYSHNITTPSSDLFSLPAISVVEKDDILTQGLVEAKRLETGNYPRWRIFLSWWE